MVVEVQRGQSRGKRWSWPAYLATLRAWTRCPTVLPVVCPDDATARWCAEPIEMGHPGWGLRPLVVGPGVLPAVTGVGEAVRLPEPAVLSVLAHGEARPRVLDALYAAPVCLEDTEQSRLHADDVLAALPEDARR